MRWLDGITDSMDMSLGKPGAGDRQGGLAFWSPWGHKESDTSEQLNNNRSSQTLVRCPISIPISQMKKLRQRGTNKQPA